ncbi:helix-turn-helix domain-containing protein [Dyadobacter sp. CY345]|uniref:helix-turn-helix transcriptional regulator n=1 Tax=Dyadobacter sp. CY345 TaxID=2909335 RepID=UPI001F2375A5|nr:helix-turn-helix transcriptional regulator [Dyadobacter sp. CY345]MCF2445399.1 helix-turn-helix domain-containing protein [Dyadobacter sp. CY345]
MTDQEQQFLYQRVGENIKNARSKANLTQEQLAHAIGLSRASVVNIEKGRQNPSIHQLYSIAEHLEITAHDLLPKIYITEISSYLSDDDLKNVPVDGLNKLASFVLKFKSSQ